MGEELEFRTAVGGYKKDDVLEYVENMNDKLDQMTRAHEEETKGISGQDPGTGRPAETERGKQCRTVRGTG